MFKFDLLNYKFNSYIILFLSLLTIFFEVNFYNKLLFILTLIFSIYQNLKKYKFKNIYSSIIAVITIYFQFILSENTFSKEFFLNLILLLVFIKFSEINKKKDHYFFNFTVLFLSISSLIYGQDFLSSINSLLLMFLSIIHLYSLNQKKIIKLNLKYIGQYLAIASLILPIIALIYFVFPRYDINIKIFDTTQNNLGIPDNLELGSFSDISNNEQVVFIYSNNLKKHNDPLYFRVKIFDLMNTDKVWITTPKNIIDRYYDKKYQIKKIVNNSNQINKLIIYPNNKTWLPALKNFDYDNSLAFNNYLNGTAESKEKTNKKKAYLSQPSKLSIDYNSDFLMFYNKLPEVFSKKLTNWSNEQMTNSLSDFDYLNNLMDYFGSGEYFYTLNPIVDNKNDYEKFFFESKSGYCEYYAGMFAILARLQDIPTRIVTGYMGGQYNNLGNFYTFRQSDAHSWVEAYIGGKGWVKFDPTLAIPNENIISFNNKSMNSLQSNNKSVNESNITKLNLIKLYYSYFDYTWTNKFLDYNKKSRNEFLKNNFENIKFNNKSYSLVFYIIFLFLCYKLIDLILRKKLFFSMLLNKIKSKNNITGNTLTHQELLKILTKNDRLKLVEIFETYEKIIFSNSYKPSIKKILYFNYKIIKFYYSNPTKNLY